MMKKYVINLDRSKYRFDNNFDNSHTRWTAVEGKYINDDNPIISKLYSYWNVSAEEHKAKCGCLLSHLSIWKHMVLHKLNNIIILEDDAELINEVIFKDLPNNGITYLGGFFMNPKITDKSPIENNSQDGTNILDKSKLRILMTLSYYIPTWEIAKEMVDFIENYKNRYRAIDIMMYKIPIPTYYNYPANYIEKPLESQIRKNKIKHSDIYYNII